MSFTSHYGPGEPRRDEIEQVAGPLILEFGTPWCGYCQAMQPSLAKFLRGLPDVRHIKIEDGRGKPLGRSFRVKLWPTLVFIRDGQVVHLAVRPDAEEIRTGLDALLGKPSA
jgi:thioredoxin 1